MPDTKITALAAIGANPINVATFPIPMVDLTDTSMAASGTTKKVTVNQILGAGGTATLASATISGDLTVDTSTLKVDSANNRVGIGTATPSVAADVVGSSAGATLEVLRLQNSGSGLNTKTRLNFYAASTNYGAITGGFGASSPELIFDINTSSGAFIWNNFGSEAMRLNSTGLGVGVSPGYKLDVAGSSAGVLRLVNINNLSTDPAAVTRLSIDGQGATWHLDNERTNGIFKITRNSTACLTIDNSGNVGIGVTPAGTGGCLQLKSGITFPATQVASTDPNTLDDYEEGAWTGTLAGATTNPTTPVTATGRYTKIGRQVSIQIQFTNVDTTGASGQIKVTGAPFTNNSSVSSTGSVLLSSIGTFTGSPAAFIGVSTTEIELYASSSAGAIGFVTHNAGASRSLYINLTYTV